MTFQGHKKHAEIGKVSGGRMHWNEIALIGAPCGIIQNLCKEIAEYLPHLKIGYVDASHSNNAPASDFELEYTDMINFHQVTFESNHMDYEWRSMFHTMDLVLVNGNHFKAEQQLVIINEAKRESLQRKTDRLTDVLGFILDEGESKVDDYLQEGKDLPTLSIKDLASISKLISEQVQIPSLKGLVLAGGKSMRMGEDKGLIEYHGRPQREHLAQLLSKFCSETLISTNASMDSDFMPLKDSFVGLGPLSGILSAFRHDPNAAWLVVATDIPLVDEKTLHQLVDSRNTSKVATSFHNPETNFPEPLITIWEPRAYPRLLQFLSMGYTCPRKALINSDIEELTLTNPEVLSNANTPEERKILQTKIK